MFIKRNRSNQGGKQYNSVLLVKGEREEVRAKRGRPKKGSRRATRVVHRTMANLSRLPDELVGIIEKWCRGELPANCAQPSATAAQSAPRAPGTRPPAPGATHLRMGPCYGVLAGLHALAKQAGLVEALGPGRMAKLALFLIYARVARQGSRLAAVRWAEDHALAEVLGLETLDEDDLYEALEWLQTNQQRIEKALAPKPTPGMFFLYDVTSSYFEGQCNELAAYGYNRDGKKHKKQLVAGLLTDENGEPISIRAHPGNTSDPTTLAPVVQRVREDFAPGTPEVVLVGDRGMIKSKGIAQLNAAGMRYISALTDAQTLKLIRQKVIDPELFDETAADIAHEGRRLILRLNPAMRERDRQRRDDQENRLREHLAKGNQHLREHPRAKTATLLKKMRVKITRYRFNSWLEAREENREVRLERNEPAREQAGLLDGSYTLVTDLPAQTCATAKVCERYLSLQKVERDIRALKTGQLEIRPIYLRKAARTEGHALVTMLALKLTRQLDALAAPEGLTVDDMIERLGGVRLVRLGPEEMGLWRLPDAYQAAQQQVLDRLPPLAPPKLSLKKAVKRRLENPRKGRPSPL